MSPRHVRKVASRPTARPRLESLEDRRLLSLFPGLTITVNTSADENARDNTLSLREAIEVANGTLPFTALSPQEQALVSIPPIAPAGTPDTIDFNIPGSGVQTITVLNSALPAISYPVLIDGYTQQPGVSHPNTLPKGDDAVLLIELSGASAPLGTDGLTISAGGGGSTITGLVINGFKPNTTTNPGGVGIVLEKSNGNVISGNFIGTDPNGTVAQANQVGVDVIDSSQNTIGGTAPADRNLISGNKLVGIALDNVDSTKNLVRGNFIGTDHNGTLPLPGSNQQQFGILISIEVGNTGPSGSQNTIGGTVQGAGNVISGNGIDGIRILGLFGGASANLIQGNIIGLDVTGTVGLSNGNNGINISEGPNNTVGGTVSAARNIISGNKNNGILIVGSASTANLVQGNFIGTNASGANLGNSLSGVLIENASNNTISGANTIGHNGTISSSIPGGAAGYGIDILGSGATGNIVLGNFIGTNASGANLGNVQNGVLIDNARNNTIGGANTIGNNSISGVVGGGILILGSGATGNVVQGNFIGTNASGADLGNSPSGVVIDSASNNTIGGANTIGRNGNGIDITGSGATGNVVQGNFIGTNASGATNLGNSSDGVADQGRAEQHDRRGQHYR